MKRLSSLFLLVVLLFALSACGDRVDPPMADSSTPQETVCTHEYSVADCDTAKTCTVCGATDGEALGHTWNDASCLTPKTCKVCGATDGEALGHTPNADDGDCTTEIKCSVCGEVTTAAKTEHIGHADDGDCTTPVTCTACDTVVTAAKTHDFSGDWKTDANGHWHVCENEGCTVTDTKADHTPNQDAATVTAPKQCTVCEYIIEPQLPHDHAYTVADKDATHHWMECTCGAVDESTKTAHNAEDDRDCTTADICSCGYTVRAVKDHVAGKDDGNCTTDIKCADCDKIASSGNTDHTDADHDYVCDNEGCQISVNPPEDENPGIDLPMDTN